MIVAYGSKPELMGAFSIRALMNRNMAAVKSSMDSAKKNLEKAKSQALIKQAEQKKSSRNILIAGAGIVGIVILKKLFQGKKSK